ncbi:SVSP family protein [Theileria parva strain Muguga]|uniref:Uncharacterized protein n=1 Tax=Theileria parva TaxID=5875 RepID=Q4N135_THEPA|nr:SVSP family protein [Theileria parva strain Muguga]EAN32271.1 SVSP family protein [Theileria parva strain Muguga]|eukprot:XP_764554.1 hypothetical protein [Theileria parva strain Muguga]
MNLCAVYIYGIIFILVGYVYSADNNNDQTSESGIKYIDDGSDEQGENFQVTERSMKPEGSEDVEEVKSATPQPTIKILRRPPQQITQPTKDKKTEPEPILYYVPQSLQSPQTYQLVSIPPIQPPPAPVPGKPSKYYVLSEKTNMYGEHIPIPVSYLEYIPVKQPVIYFIPVGVAPPYSPHQSPFVTYPVLTTQPSSRRGESQHPNLEPPTLKPNVAPGKYKHQVDEPRVPRKTIQILRRPSRPHEQTKDSTTPEPPKTDQVSGEQPSQPSDQKPQPSGEPSEPLQPERIPVELGSDEEESEDEGDKEGAAGGDGGEGDEEEEISSKTEEICKEIVLFKKDSDGNIIPMTENDYKKIISTEYENNYEFLANLEEVKCDGESVYSHIDGKFYPLSLTYKKPNNSFIIAFEDSFLRIKRRKGEWMTKSKKFKKHLKIYIKDEKGNEVEGGEEDDFYRITFNKAIKYKFKPGKKCNKIVFGDKLIWEKTPSDDYPIGFSINDRLNVVVFFEKYFKTFAKRSQGYRLKYTQGK